MLCGSWPPPLFLNSPTPKPNLEDEGPLFVWPLPFDRLALVALPGAYAPASIAVQVIGAHKGCSPSERLSNMLSRVSD
jgi:hypothetical protein